MARYVGRRRRNRVKIILISILVAGLVSLIVIEALIVSGQRSDAVQGADALIILGAGVNGSTPSLALQNRLETAAAYLLENMETQAVLSGGKGPGEDITEAEAMRRYLEARGIAPERLHMEDKSSRTSKNMEYSKKILDDLGLSSRKIVVVSQGFHLFRAKQLARRNGLKVTVLAAPAPNRWLDFKYRLREYFSVVFMVFGR